MSRLNQIVREWQQARNNAADSDVSTVDAHHALDAGLPVLAALHALASRLEQANFYVSAVEMLAEVRPIIQLAVGEAMRRAERAGCYAEIPGIPSVPMTELLEQLAE